MKLIIILCILTYVLTLSESKYIKRNLKEDLPKKEWWESAVFYQIYPRSFKDSTSNGVGDIQGIISKLEHIKNSGINGLWLSPIFKSPMKDFGYDISDFKEVDPIFGTNKDLEELFAKAKKLGIKIILDFVPNHTSDKHDWFLKSIKRDAEYSDYYIWVKSSGVDENGKPKPPNNWQSVFYGSAWEWNNERQEFYLHQFDKSQPDLNYRNSKVVEAMKDVLTFWLEKGADGFRIDAINHMFEVEDLRDEPLTHQTDDPFDYGYTDHIYTKDQDETYDMVYDWRDLLDKFKADNDGEDRILMTEAYANITYTQKFYGDGKRKGSHMPFNFVLMKDLNKNSKAKDFADAINKWLDPIKDQNRVSNWLWGNHDNSRMASVFGENMVNILHTISMTLPGIAITYNGEEIGMINNDYITFEETQDPQACNKGDKENYKEMSRDPERTPFQWDSSAYAGFMDETSKKLPWLPVHPQYKRINLKQQTEAPKSVYKYYQQLVELRKDPVFVYGEYKSGYIGDNVFVYSRSLKGYGKYTIVLNIGREPVSVDVTEFAPEFENEVAVVVLATPLTEYTNGMGLNSHSISLNGYDGVILREKLIEENREKDWWEDAVIYQIYPRSFKDSNDDGIGDIKGIISKLDHLQDLGITAIWLSPVFKSPMDDFGYDISDFLEVDPIFGTNEDLEELFAKAKEMGIKVLLDFVPNHTSDQHDWFKKSIAEEGDYKDYYIWKDPIIDSKNVRHPPNNWMSVFYGSAWEWNEDREQYYLHQFDKAQPDLDYRNPKVMNEMKKVLTFWLEKGADGFRMDAVNHIMEVEDFRDEPINPNEDDVDSFDHVLHHYTTDLPGTYEVIYEFRKHIDEWTAANSKDSTRIMVTEAYANITSTMAYYESFDGRKIGSHFPFNFLFIMNLNENSESKKYKEVIEYWLKNMPDDHTPNWVLGNHDRPRVGSRFGSDRIDAMNILSLTLPGVAVTYNGDEIGMLDYRNLSWAETVDPQACNKGDPFNYQDISRDPQRTPFQWDDSEYAGFTTKESKKPWLPVHQNYKEINLAKQKNDERSHYSLYKTLVELRKHDTFKKGDITIKTINQRVLSYTRDLKDSEKFVVVINVADSIEDISLKLFDELPDSIKVVAASAQSKYKIGDKVQTELVVLKKYDAIVFSAGAGAKLVISLFVLFASVIINLR